MNSSFMLNDIVKIIRPGEGYSMATEIAKLLNARYWRHGRYINNTIILYRVVSMTEAVAYKDKIIVYIERLDGREQGYLIGEKGLELVERDNFLKKEDFEI